MEEGHDVECVTEVMRLFSAAQQRRVNVVTCIFVRRHKAKSQEGVMNFHLSLCPLSTSFLDCNSLLLTIHNSVFRHIDTRSAERDSEVAFCDASDSVP